MKSQTVLTVFRNERLNKYSCIIGRTEQPRVIEQFTQANRKYIEVRIGKCRDGDRDWSITVDGYLEDLRGSLKIS